LKVEIQANKHLNKVKWNLDIDPVDFN